MSGFALLSYTTIVDWSRLMGTDPTPEEVDALIRLDSVMLFPGDEKAG